jgi:hypothetical protein
MALTMAALYRGIQKVVNVASGKTTGTYLSGKLIYFVPQFLDFLLSHASISEGNLPSGKPLHRCNEALHEFCPSLVTGWSASACEFNIHGRKAYESSIVTRPPINSSMTESRLCLNSLERRQNCYRQTEMRGGTPTG